MSRAFMDCKLFTKVFSWFEYSLFVGSGDGAKKHSPGRRKHDPYNISAGLWADLRVMKIEFLT